MASLLYRLLVRTAVASRRVRFAQRAWDAAWTRIPATTSVTQLRLHGRDAWINVGNPYPVYVLRHRTYNMPLVALVRQVSHALDRPIRVVDVGAAIGDTAMLLMQRCPGSIAELHCVEGDDAFFGILERNLRSDARCHLYRAFLSDGRATERELVRVSHAGTASAQGELGVTPVSLDDLLEASVAPDVIKVDTDGLDARVLTGARRLLARDRPAVLFEWSPQHCLATGTDVNEPFRLLCDIGYETFLMFDKFGAFSHFVSCGDLESLELLRRFSLDTRRVDWHYDVTALGAVELDPTALADLRRSS